MSLISKLFGNITGSPKIEEIVKYMRKNKIKKIKWGSFELELESRK